MWNVNELENVNSHDVNFSLGIKKLAPLVLIAEPHKDVLSHGSSS